MALIFILGLAAALRLWHLDQNGFGRQYYAAGVRSMLGSWHGFFFNAFDPAGFVSLDKPPVALWMQVASAKILGFGAFSVMLPQVLEGLVSVALVHRLVARRFGQSAGLVAALFLAVTPICVAIDRSNNTDSCLIMVLLLAAWALIRAAETANVRLLVLAMALVGIGFNVKMAAALVVVPTFGVVYLCAAPGITLRRRLAHLGLAAAVMVVVSLSWVTPFDLTPAAERPYAGSTQHNSMLELALLHNGFERFIAKRSADIGSRGSDVGSAADTATAADGRATSASVSPATLWDQTPVGPLRLATPHLAGQMGWWLPLAIFGAVAGAGSWRRLRRLSAEQANVLIWVGWAFTYALVFSFAGGVFHTYYVAVLGPPLAALAGIGWAALWQRHRDGTWRYGLPLLLLVTAVWQLGIEQGYVAWRFEDWRSALLIGSVAALVLAGAGLLVPPWHRVAARVSTPVALLGLVAMLVTPMAWALSTVIVRPNVAAPAANVAVLGASTPEADASPAPRSRGRRLVEFLDANRNTERFLLAVPNAMQAAPFIVRTGKPVMAMGGYLGRDPILAPADLERMAAAGELRFVVLGGFALVAPDTPQEEALADWVRANGRRVDSALWREPADASRVVSDRQRWASTPIRLYDLRPGEEPYQAARP